MARRGRCTRYSASAKESLAHVYGTPRALHHAPDHRLELRERHRLVRRIERVLIVLLAELRRVGVEGVILVLVAHIAIEAEVLEEVVALEDAVLLDHEEILIGHERLQDRRRDV